MSRVLRVLLLDHAPVFGGTQAFADDLALAADADRFHLTLVTHRDSAVSFRAPNIYRLALPPIRRNPAAALFAGASLAALARTADALMSLTARMHIVGAIAAALARRPLIWRLADDTLPSPLASALAGVPTCIAPVSQFIAARCSPRPSITRVIPDGVQLPPASPPHKSDLRRLLSLDAASTYATIAARLVRAKGHATFIRALSISRAANLTGLVVGGDDDQPGELGGRGLRQELEAMGGNVRFLGHRADLQNLLAASDIFVNASTGIEGGGRAMLEAMMLGLPVVASRIGGVPEILGTAGRLFAAGDATALAAALEMDATTRARLGEEAHARARQHFALPAVAVQFERLWHDAAGI